MGKYEVETMRYHRSLEERMADKIYDALKGHLTPDRDTVVNVLNQKRRKEGIYGKQRISRK